MPKLLNWRSSILRTCILVLLANILIVNSEAATSEALVKSEGPNLFALAWPTAKYTGVEVKSIQSMTGGADLTIILRGKSTFDDSVLWAEAFVKIREGKFIDLRWGTHSPSLFSPGSTVSDLPHALDNINKGRAPRDFDKPPHRTPAEIASDRRREAEIQAFDAQMKNKLSAHQAKMERLAKGLKRSPTTFHLKASPYCTVYVAVHFQAFNGQWVTAGWFVVYGEEDNWPEVYSIGSDVWLYAKTTQGQEWSGGDKSRELPVISDRPFIRTGSEVLRGPGLQTVKFFKLDRVKYDSYARNFTFSCYR
jgi:hypothetical protein